MRERRGKSEKGKKKEIVTLRERERERERFLNVLTDTEIKI